MQSVGAVQSLFLKRLNAPMVLLHLRGVFYFMAYRDFYLHTYEDFENIHKKNTHSFRLHNSVMYSLRMYANLFNRDMRKKLLNENSFCNNCNSKEKLTIDHIIPISKGGKNLESNVQILCTKCNLLKKDKI